MKDATIESSYNQMKSLLGKEFTLFPLCIIVKYINYIEIIRIKGG